jgi:hypothetical protein
MHFRLTTLAAAAALVASGSAFAVVDLNSDAGLRNYAAELVSAAPFNIITDDNLDTTNALGFGISVSQTRFIRFDLGNATFNNSVVAADLTIGTIGTVTASQRVVAQGGTGSDNSVVFQITADANYGPSQAVILALGSGGANGIDVLDPTKPVTITYRQYGTPNDASNNVVANAIVTTTNTIATFGSALVFSATPTTTTADVSATNGSGAPAPFSKFLTTGTTPPNPNSAVNTQVGTVTVGTNGSFDPTGAPVTLPQLIAAGTKLTVSTDDSYLVSLGSPNSSSLFVGTSPACGGVAFGSSGTANSARDIVTDANALASAPICYIANGSGAIAVQNFQVGLTVVKAAGAGTVSPAGTQFVGNFVHNGTTLKFPFAVGKGGTTTLINLANQGSVDAKITTLQCYSPVGTTTLTPGTSIPKGTTKAIGMAATGCPASSTSIQINLDVPTGTVIGSLVRTNNTSGDLGLDGAVGNK